MRSPFIVAALLVALAPPAWAQSAPPSPPAALRGIIERVAPDRESLDLRTRDGGEKTLELPRDAKVARVVAATLADVKPGDYVGVAAAPNPDGGPLKALEVHIFPASMRGVGEGFRPFDLAPGSTMTNGDVQARVDHVNGPQIVVAYNGGQQTIVVDNSTPIVAIQPGGLGDLMAGAAVVARGGAGEGGSYQTTAIVVGVAGIVPPM
jgi:hypothetical protein